MASISGLHIHHTFVDHTGEITLVNLIDQQLWLTDLKRRVQHYGYRYNYNRRSLDTSQSLGPLPSWLTPLTQRLLGIMTPLPNQVIINEYLPGQGISAHIDCIPCFGDTIVSLSLLSSCVMLFSNPATGEQIPVLLEPGSLTVMQGEARYNWKHAIAPRKSDEYQGRHIERSRRLSLTFRHVLTVP